MNKKENTKEERKTRKEKHTLLLLSIALILIINTTLVSATVDLVTPTNNTHTNQQNITFYYYVNLDNTTNTTNCTLILDSDLKLTDPNIINPGFNEFTTQLNPGRHTWMITCTSSNTTETSEQRTIIIDVTQPTIILVLPINNTQINTSQTEITFIVINTPKENSSCNITLHNNLLNNSVNKSVIAEDSETTTTIINELDDGLYTWNVKCYDQANNSAISETRTFKINTTSPPPKFNISIEKTEYLLGENGLMTIRAPNGTSIRVEVCPDKPGFVECEIPVTGEHIMNYPFQEYLPFTNYQGRYTLEAFFNYSGTTEVKELSYEVLNNINIEIDINGDPRKNVPIILKAQAQGGVGPLNYTWHLSNGSRINKDRVNITYNEKGNHTETVVVKDSYNNTKNKSITINVKDSYQVEIIVKDSATNQPIKGATIEIEDEKKITDTNGKANYYLKAGRREIIILKENYSIYLDELNITKDESFTILLHPLNSTKPEISLISPDNNTEVTGPNTSLVFKAEYQDNLNCSTYINEDDDGFFTYLGSLEVKNTSEQVFNVTDLENKTYWWKVECVDNDGNTGISPTWQFKVGRAASNTGSSATPQQLEAIKTFNDKVKEFEQVLDVLEGLPREEKELADALGIPRQVEDVITELKNTIRDVDSLNFRADLSGEEKEAEKQKLILRAEEAYQKAPVSIEILKSDSFVDYIDDAELKEILEMYLESKELEDDELGVSKKKLLGFLDELQQEVVISTKIKNARVMYKDGAQKDITAVIREIKTYNLTEGAFLLEIIPKDIVISADKVISPEEFEVVKQDPIISFKLKGDKTLTYYFEKNINPALLRNIRTAVFINPESLSKEQITGFSTKNLRIGGIKQPLLIIVLIILLSGFLFVSIKYDGISTAKYMYYKIHGHKSLHYINVILNEINDNLEIGNLEKAISLYEEAKGAYSELSTLAKNDVYEKVVMTANKIRSYSQQLERAEKNHCVEELKEGMRRVPVLLSNGQISAALDEYKRIEAAYNQLDNGIKEMLHSGLVALGNKIQIMIDNEKDKI